MLGVLLGIAGGAAALLEQHLLEALGREQPLLAADVGLGRVARELALPVALRGAAIVAGLLVHLGGDAQVARDHVRLGREIPLLLLRVDRARGVVLARLRVELRRLEEAVLIVADLGRALGQLGREEVFRRVVEQTDRDAELGGLGRHALLRDPRGLGARLLLPAAVLAGIASRLALRAAVRVIADGPQPAAARQQRHAERDEAGRREHEAPRRRGQPADHVPGQQRPRTRAAAPAEERGEPRRARRARPAHRGVGERESERARARGAATATTTQQRLGHPAQRVHGGSLRESRGLYRRPERRSVRWQLGD